MKRMLVFLLVAGVLAAPCAYDAFSPEPSPLAALLAVAAAEGPRG